VASLDASDSSTGTGTVQDFDLHGIVGIRLVDATSGDIAKVQRQLGPLQATLDRDPDITIGFVDRATTKTVTYAGLNEGGFNEEGFFVLQGRDGVVAKVLLPFEQIGHGLHISCERALPMVPDLLAIINLIALTKGVLPLHASAFSIEGTGVLITGWAKAGKTETLLGCMKQGARYIGDEWVYLTPDGSMLGLPEPIRLWAWHLEQFPEILQARRRRDRMRLSMWNRAALSVGRASRMFPGAGVLRKGAPVITRQAYLQVPPEDLFGADAMQLKGPLDVVVLVLNHDSPEIVSRPVSPAEVAGRMAASLATERAQFMEHYDQFRYAFPDRVSDVVERAHETETALLQQVLEGRPAAKVLHPYPCDITDLGNAVMHAVRTCMTRHTES
ncbi:MAG: hypothetical protein QOK30_973, partial [Nocardioidaceae bacterium]|nr:hypothetical protein [Nocardioidaceae bacterium]